MCKNHLISSVLMTVRDVVKIQNKTFKNLLKTLIKVNCDEKFILILSVSQFNSPERQIYFSVVTAPLSLVIRTMQ